MKIPEFIEKFLVEFLLNQLKEAQYLQLNYLESQKFDFSDIPVEESKRKEYHDFILDDRRFVNKSIKLLLEKEILTEYIYKSFLETIAKVFLSLPIDQNTVEIDPENQDDEYLKSLEQKKIQIEIENKKFEKMKKKIKFKFVKPEDLKKKRDNMGGFVTVQSIKQVIESMIEIEDPAVEINNQNKEGENLNTNNENNQQNAEESKNEENIPKDKVSNEESLQISENKQSPNEVIEPIKIKIDYMNEVDVFINSNLPIDTYILHFDMTEGFIAYTIRSIKRVLSKNYKVNIDLNESFNTIKEKINEINIYIYEHVLNKEKYLGKTIIPIEVKPELPQENAEGDLNSGLD